MPDFLEPPSAWEEEQEWERVKGRRKRPSAWAEKYPYSAGQVFGTQTARMLGLEPGRGYREEEYEAWFGQLRSVSAALENYPQYKLPYWTRAAQMGISGEQYLSAFRAPPTGLTTQEQAIQDYAFGKTDINPFGGRVIPPGITPTIGVGPPSGGQREEYPFLPPKPTPKPVAPKREAGRYGYAPPARWLLY